MNLIGSDLYAYAETVYDWIDWEKTAQPKEMLLGLFRCYKETGKVSLLAKHIQALLKNVELEQLLYGAVHSFYEDCSESRETFLADLESLKVQTGNFPYFHLLYTEKQGTTTEQDIRDYYEKSDRKYDEEVAILLLGKAEKKLLQYSEQKKIGFITSAIKEYIGRAKAYADVVYGPELWEDEKCFVNSKSGNVPGEITFARTMDGVLEAEDGAVFATGVKEALKYHPVMLPAIRALLEEREVLSLAKQLKTVVQAQLAEGKTEEARAILSELGMMLPEDEEVKELLVQIKG
jgi:hypothetical protein